MPVPPCAPPPTSRKFAALPPAWATTSSVDITSPTPLPRMICDLAVQLDVGDAAGWRAICSCRMAALTSRIAADVRVLVERVVVDRHLRVERAQLSLRRDDQRVDLDEHRVLLAEAAVGGLEDRGDLLVLGRRDRGGEGEAAGDPRVVPAERVEVQPREGLGALCRDLLDLDAALGRQHQQGALGTRSNVIERVVLACDVGRALDPQAPHDVPADVEAEDVAREALGLVGAGRELDAAGLAATAGEHLRLDDDRAAELLCRGARLGRRVGDAALGDGDAVAGEQLLALVLIEVHAIEDSRKAFRESFVRLGSCRPGHAAGPRAVRLLAAREVSPLEAIDAALARIGEVDGALNAVPTLSRSARARAPGRSPRPPHRASAARSRACRSS